MKKMIFAIMTFVLPIVVSAQQIPPPPQGGEALPEWRALHDDAGAKAIFSRMEGSLPVQWDAAGFVRLPVNFVGTKHERVSWDIKLKLDLRMRKGIQFYFYCSDLSPISYFTIYFRSGKGWYSAPFSPEGKGVWEKIVVNKNDTHFEGDVAGWSGIDAIRISGWRGNDLDATCAIANLGLAGDKPEALVIRAESNVDKMQSEAKGFSTYAATVSDTFDAINVESMQVADSDLTAAQLANVKLAVLPYNPKLPDEALRMLEKFVADGGKLLVCYSMPAGVAELLGLRLTNSVVPEPDTFTGFVSTAEALPAQPQFAPQASWRTAIAQPLPNCKARVIARWRNHSGQDTPHPAITLTPTGAYIGHIWMGGGNRDANLLMSAIVEYLKPGVWRKGAEKALAEIGVVGDAVNFAQLQAIVNRATPSNEARQALVRAADERKRAQELLDAGKWIESQQASTRAGEAAQRAWFISRQSRAAEHRAFWCHSAFGLPGKSWDEAIGILKSNGFTTILPNMLWGGTTYYPSKVLPPYAELADKGDQLALCLAACKKHGIECHVWKVNWNMSNKASAEFVQRMVSEGRVQRSYGGEIEEHWLCPSHPANQDLEVAAMTELARNYAVDGVHFDYIRYPDNSRCFCDGCRARFEARLGHAVVNWPQDTRNSEPVKEAWLEFRRSNIDTVVARVARDVRQVRRGVKISAAVFRNWPIDRNSVGQDWKMWCDKGWLDFVCPMDYVDSNQAFENMVKRQLEFAGRVPLYPGIGLSCWKDSRDAVKLAQQIEITRKLGLTGFTVFNYGSNAEEVLPWLRLGITAP